MVEKQREELIKDKMCLWKRAEERRNKEKTGYTKCTIDKK